MSIKCDHQNKLPQSLLKIDKKLITDPMQVNIAINLAHLNSFDTVEEGVIQEVDIPDTCGGTGTIKGQVLIEKVILVAGVHYTVIMYDTVTKSKVYGGAVEYATVYSLHEILPLGVEPEIDPANVTTVFKNLEWRLLQNDPLVDYYLYTVNGEVELVVTTPE